MMSLEEHTTCVIAGGGPAGMMLGYLLARAGIAVTILEKHADFLRDFRGDTIHPSTLEVMQQLGLLKPLLAQSHQKVLQISAHIGDMHFTIADFSQLPIPYIVLMPQWDFLNLLAEAGKSQPSFNLRMNTEVKDLLVESGRIAGVKAYDTSTKNDLIIRATLVVGADGRTSQIRKCANMAIIDMGVPIDVLWMCLPKRNTDQTASLGGRIDRGKILVMLDRGNYWQCAFIIKKGTFPDWHQRGLSAFQQALATLQPMFSDRVEELHNWDKIKLLTVKLDRLQHWAREGLLCIGDAAHAMSPVGGIGINLAIQDAVATANCLAVPLLNNCLTLADLHMVQQRRFWPTKITQGIQAFIHRHAITPALQVNSKITTPPWPLRLLNRSSWLRCLLGRAVGIGIRPERVSQIIICK
ncbi:FAD-dependent oxidoreductase [Candidatus Nitrosacidococcus sp. I8]|uniref:FAD-dependent oxidoreductase n=1 Tax=Candidatus Nitrosacidococcus sp. I8 TaxID=2942908 RepID=UPI002226FDB2|nr:FAD-dependent oxidoreductase [Candidatus Nitrosacidococcus sp. I8]CAH9018487.1 6-methylpretetramide 4-monooxygenase [Candidatus Nitrosacidococcus sp. I8]